MGHNGFDMFEPTIRCDNNSTSKCSYFGGLLAGYLLCWTAWRQQFGGDCYRINRIHIPRWHESASFLNVESESKHRTRNCTIERGNSFEILDFYMTHHLHLEFRFQTVRFLGAMWGSVLLSKVTALLERKAALRRAHQAELVAGGSGRGTRPEQFCQPVGVTVAAVTCHDLALFIT